MKLGLNAKEIVIVDVLGTGLLIGQLQYNRQTESAIFVLEKAQYFDLFFPCAILLDNQHGIFIRPHIASFLSNGTIRINRSNISYFIMENDINPQIKKQYIDLISMHIMRKNPTELIEDNGNKRQANPTPGKIISLLQNRDNPNPEP